MVLLIILSTVILKVLKAASQTWRQYQDIIYTGTYDSQSDRDTIRIIEKNGIKFALLSYTQSLNEYNTNPYKLLKQTAYAVPLLEDTAAIKADVQKDQRTSRRNNRLYPLG